MGTNVRGESGRYSTPAHTYYDVTTSSNTILAANTARKHVLLINNTATDIYIKLGADAVVNEGIVLAGTKGFSYEMSEKLGNLYTGAINAIHGGSGTQRVLITEGI